MNSPGETIQKLLKQSELVNCLLFIFSGKFSTSFHFAEIDWDNLISLLQWCWWIISFHVSSLLITLHIYEQFIDVLILNNVFGCKQNLQFMFIIFRITSLWKVGLVFEFISILWNIFVHLLKHKRISGVYASVNFRSILCRI